MKWLVLFLLSWTLSSCTTLKENFKRECAAKEWSKLGYETALAGKKADSAELSRCQSAGTETGTKAYEESYRAGLNQFCTYENGFNFGRQGSEYQNSCPASVENDFLSGYTLGKKDFDRLQAAISQAESISLLNSRDGRMCVFNSDCKLQLNCELKAGSENTKRCEIMGKICTSNSDCMIEGSCTFSKCSFKIN